MRSVGTRATTTLCPQKPCALKFAQLQLTGWRAGGLTGWQAGGQGRQRTYRNPRHALCHRRRRRRRRALVLYGKQSTHTSPHTCSPATAAAAAGNTAERHGHGSRIPVLPKLPSSPVVLCRCRCRCRYPVRTLHASTAFSRH